MAAIKHILLIRHGLTDANTAAVIQGHQQTSLNVMGHQQAALLAERMKQRGPRIELLISSDLLRASQTADAIANACGCRVGTDPQWRERFFGPWEGKTADQVDIWRMAAGEFDPPGAEASAAFRGRIRRALLDAARQCPSGGTAAVVTHGGPCRMVLRMLADGELPLADGSPAPALGMIANCSIMHLEAQTDGSVPMWRLVRLNDVDHLDVLHRTATDAG